MYWTLGIACMAQNCEVLATEDFVLNLLNKSQLREKFQLFIFRDYVKSHPQLRFCPGVNCQVVLRSKEPQAKRAICTYCKTVFWYVKFNLNQTRNYGLKKVYSLEFNREEGQNLKTISSKGQHRR